LWHLWHLWHLYIWHIYIFIYLFVTIHSNLYVGERLTDQECETVLKDCMDPEDEDGFIPYTRKCLFTEIIDLIKLYLFRSPHFYESYCFFFNIYQKFSK
jgi:hypothetical protein